MNLLKPRHRVSVHPPHRRLRKSSRRRFSFLRDHTPRRRQIVLCALVFFGIVVGGSAVWGALNYRYIKTLKNESLAAKESFDSAQTAVANQDFTTARNDLKEAEQHFTTARSALSHFPILRRTPIVRTQLGAVENLLNAGVNLASGLQTFMSLGEEVMSVLREHDDDVTLGDISPEEKRAMLQKLAESPADLAGVRADIELAIFFIEQIPARGLFGPLREAVEPVRDQLPLLQTLVEQAIPIVESLPSLAGYPTEITYLFLLQNNRELRPTGGFIGTYGIVKLDAGELTKFETNNIYNLDEPAKDWVTELAPGPIAQHTSTQHAFMRNANWSPDFPTSARAVRQKYYEERGPEKNINGVIAVTPTFLASLLDVTGPITIAGTEFTSKNFFAELEDEVQFGFRKNGKNLASRKDIIGILGKELMARLFTLPKNRLGNLWTTFTKNVSEKHILIYVDDPQTQQLIRTQRWAGEMPSSNGDVVMVVDANLAALKTDDVMERALDYHVAQEGDDLVGTLNVTYRNTGQFTRLHTRYRTSTRIYLPAGSTLLEHAGYLTGDKIQGGKPTAPEVGEETFTREDGSTTTLTVVSGFIAIEPQEEGTLHLQYRLPEKLKQQVREGFYTLRVQKQPGTAGHSLTFSLDIGAHIERVRPLDVLDKRDNNNVRFVTDLSVDREFVIDFE